MEDKMLNANLINKYVYTIDSVLRLHDAEVYRARMERKFVADSTKRSEDSAMYVRWLDAIISNNEKNKKKGN